MFITNSTGTNGTVSLLSGRNPFSGIFTDSMTPVMNLSPVTTINASALGSKKAKFSLFILVLWAMEPTHTHTLKREVGTVLY
jgi:hypothetical protein